MRAPKVARIPAPALHVRDDGLNLPCAFTLSGGFATQLRQHCLELAIGLLLRAEAVKRLADIRCIRDAAEDVSGFRRHLRCGSRGIRESAQPADAARR